MMGCFKFLKDIEYLKKRIIEINKQIDNIYEILEFFTNESKRKNLDESNSNVFTKNNKQQPIFLTKNNSSYKKLEKAMKEPVKEYDQIKNL